MIFNNGFLHGGTERQFVRVAQNLNRNNYELFVGCLRRCGPFLNMIEPLGIPIIEFPIRSLHGFETMRWFWRLVQFLRHNRIAVLHAFDFYSNAFAIPAARLAGVPVVLASRRELLEARNSWQRNIVRAVCWLATGVVANSRAVEADMYRSGFAKPGKLTVIHNGIDCDVVQPTKPPEQTRRQLDIPEGTPLVSLVADLRRENTRGAIPYYRGRCRSAEIREGRTGLRPRSASTFSRRSVPGRGLPGSFGYMRPLVVDRRSAERRARGDDHGTTCGGH